MAQTVAAVRAALRVIGAPRSAPLEAAMRKLPAGPALQETRLRLIALAKAAQKTREPAYHEAIGLLDRDLRKTPRLVTRADPLFRSAQKKYAALKRASESVVTRWEWWSGPRYEIEPLFHERNGFAMGKPIPEPKTKRAKDGAYAFGFDEAGRHIVTREFTSVGCKESVFVHAKDRIERWAYGEDHVPIHVALFVLRGGHLREAHSSARAGTKIERYRYESATLVTIDTVRWSDAGFYSERLVVVSDALGVERIDGETCVGTFMRWQRPQRSQTLAALFPLVREHYLALLLARLATLKLEGPAFALALCIDGEAFDHLMPPSIAIGLAGDRHARRRPAEWSWFDRDELHLWDERMKTLVTPLNQLLAASGKHALAMRWARALAKELNRATLPMPRTADFVVFATDTSGA